MSGGQEARVHRAACGLQPLAGGQGGDGGEAVADHRVGQPDGAGGPGHARGQRRLDRVVTLDVHAAGRRRGSADGHDPGRAFGAGGHGLARLDRNAHGGEIGSGGPAGAVQPFALHLHAGGVVEDGPDRLAAPEDGGADRAVPGETHHRLLALDLGRHRHRPADRHRGGSRAVRPRARRIQVQPDGAVGGPAGGARPLGQGQDQFGRPLGGAGLDLLQPLGRIDAQAADVGGGGRADADHDGAAVLAHPRARSHDPGELDLGEACVGADADLDRRAGLRLSLGQRRRRSQGREDDDARRGGRHGRLQNALLGGGPGHIARMLARRALIAVNGA
ncbi:ligA [Brevundimonas diminuta ATCC 11568]|nr:ligA [Brevundimonas diminuta ATCC 11568]